MSIEFRGTTICAVRKDGKTAIAGDGQVTMGESVIFKNNAKELYNRCETEFEALQNNYGYLFE